MLRDLPFSESELGQLHVAGKTAGGTRFTTDAYACQFPGRSELGLSLRIRRDAAVCPDGRRIGRYSSRRDRSILDAAPASGAGGVNNQLFARSQPTSS